MNSQSKFYKTLTASDSNLKGKRADIATSTTALHQTELVNSLKRQVLDIDMQIESHSDLGPNSSMDLTIAKDVDLKNWVDELQALKIDKLNLEVQLKLAEETLNEWFGGEAEKTEAGTTN